MSIYFIISVGTKVFVDDYIQPSSLFANMLLSTIIAASVAMVLDIAI